MTPSYCLPEQGRRLAGAQRCLEKKEDSNPPSFSLADSHRPIHIGLPRHPRGRYGRRAPALLISHLMNTKVSASPIELSFRGFVLGILITVVFTAANVYLGLKVGLTFATSIPAAVISMAVLSTFRNATIVENNIVQTIASAAGTLSSIIFVLPGLLIVGWWSGFPFWESFAICAAGGVLGVLFTIPLRRTLVTNSDLPYPVGVAA